MSQSPITITYSLEEVLTRLERKIEQQFAGVNQKFDKLEEKIDKQLEVVNQKFDKLEKKIDKLDEKVDHLTIEVTALTIKVATIDQRLEKVEGTQKNQVWTLITLLGGSLIAVGFRSFFMGNNP